MNSAVAVKTRSDFPHDVITLLDTEQVCRLLSKDDLDPKSVDQLYDFGKMLLEQIRDLRDSYDSKLTNCLGWSSGIFAVVMVGASDWIKVPGALGKFASAGVVFAFLSIIMAMLGLKSVGGWKWPSEKDWFSPEFLKWPNDLKKQHVVVMHAAHRSYSERTQIKGHFLMAAEYSLIVAALCLGASVFIKAFT